MTTPDGTEIPTQGLAGLPGLVRECCEALAGLSSVTHLATQDHLTGLLAELGELILMAQAGQVSLVAEALERNLPAEEACPLTPTDWVAVNARNLAQPATASQVVRLAAAVLPSGMLRPAGALSAYAEGASLGRSVLGAQTSIACATVAMAEMTRLRPHLQESFIPHAWDAYAAIAAAGDTREIRRLRPELCARYGRADLLETRDEFARAHTRLSRGTPDPIDGLVDYRLTLDPAAAATLEAALDPLSKPVPDPDGTHDPRPFGRRRAEALLDLIARAVHAANDLPIHPATQLTLTVTAADLAGNTGVARVMSSSDVVRYLGAGSSRRLTCNPTITPVLLGADGTPEVIGRSKRLFSRRQIRALHVRDGGCTFPLCTRPAGWSDAHHLIHWADGGGTDLDNAALLCSHHHHVVHRRRLYGYLDPPATPAPTTGAAPHPSEHREPADLSTSRPGKPGAGVPRSVHWDLSPGSYDRALARLRAAA